MSSEETERNTIAAQCREDIIKWRNGATDLAHLTGAAREAVLIVKDMELWKDKGYSSFTVWLEKECGITPRWGFELAAAAKMIHEIEEVAGSSKTLAPLAKKKNLEKLRALPDAAIKKLKTLPPAKAAKAALRAIESSDGPVPSASEVAKEVKKLAPRDKTVPFDNHPVLLALDNEWVSIQKMLPHVEIKAKTIYERFREAVEKVL